MPVRRHAPMPTWHKPHGPFIGRRQRGQTLILSVICLLVLCLGLFMVFDTGQVVSKKVQLTNAADAAAYSVAIEQARALNTAAYLNRAEVANQVAIAQLVSLQSYGNYADSLLARVGQMVRDLGVALDASGVGIEIGAVLTEIGQNMLTVQKDVVKPGQKVTDKLYTVLVNGLNGLNAAYAGAQQYVFGAFSGQAFLSTIQDVVKANTIDAGGASNAKIPTDGRFLLAAQLAVFAGVPGISSIPAKYLNAVTVNAGYTTRYTIPQAHSQNGITGVERKWAGDRVATVMMQSRDGFSSKRNANFDPFQILGVGGIEDLLPVSFSLPKLGSTDLVEYDRWVAVDSLSARIKIGCGLLSFGLCWKFKAPLAYGAAAALRRSSGGYGAGVISPGVRLTKGTGDRPQNYRPGHGYGWYSPYTDTTAPPYQGALDNTLGQAEIANDPSDEMFTSATPNDVVWMPIYMLNVGGKLKKFVDPHVGLQDYNDVSPGKAVEPYAVSADDKNDIGPIFTVFVQQPDGTVRTGANIGMEGGDLRLKNGGQGGAVSAISSSQVYYDRPMDLSFMKRNFDPDQRELGNLFEPYWQARLVPTPGKYKLALNLVSGI